MKLLTKAILNSLPLLHETEGKDLSEVEVKVKFFCPWGSWTWYATEFDPVDGLFFGLVDGDEKELGYFSLEDLESLSGPFGLKIERDLYFKPTPLSKLIKS